MEEFSSELEQLELSRQKLGQTFNDLHSALQFTLQREEQLQAKERELQELQESLDKRERELQAKERRVDLVLIEVRVKEEKCDERRKEIELKEKRLNEKDVKLADKFSGRDDDPFHIENGKSAFVGLPMERENVSLSPDSLPKGNHFSVKMGGVDLILFLDDHDDEDCDIIACDEAADSFQAKLVLHSIMDPNPSYSREKKHLILSICIEDCCLLVTQFRGISPQINQELKDEATKFAHSWKPKLVKKRRDPLEVLSFLQFLAAYGLASSFDAVELISLLDTDNWQKKAPDLCEVLGFADMIPKFIDDLIKRERRIEAVKYIHTLNVINKFSQATLLNDHLTFCTRRAAMKSSNERQNSIEAQIEFINAEVKALKDVVKCIVDYNIKFGLSTEMLEQRIMQQEKERETKVRSLKNLNTSVAGSHSNLLDQQRDQQHIRPVHSTLLSPAINLMNVPTSSSRIVHSSFMVAPSSQTFAPTLSAIPLNQMQQQNRINHPQRTVLPYRTTAWDSSTTHAPPNMQLRIHKNQDTLNNGGQVPSQ